MGSFTWLTRRISSQPIAVQYGSDVVRFMQIRGTSELTINGAVEVSVEDTGGIAVALSSFKGKRCIACLPAKDVLVQHIRIELEDGEQQILERLLNHDVRWANAEVRHVCVKTTGTGNNARQEILCVGVDRILSQTIVESIEDAGGDVVAVTVPLYASIRAFDKLYRRDGDEKVTSMLIDMDDESSMVMIAHGANCVFAHHIESITKAKADDWKPEPKATPALLPITNPDTNEFERRSEDDPRGLYGVQENKSGIDAKISTELERCLRHHDSLFPDRVVDRIIFTGTGANDSTRCSAIASELGLAGFIADPSAWIDGAAELAAGPAWTTAAGVCLRYSENAA